MKKKKRIAIVGSVGVPAYYGGFETLVDNLLPYLTLEYDVTVYCCSKAYPKKERLKYYRGARLIYVPIKANGIQSILYDSVSMIMAFRKHDLYLNLGVSGGIMFPVIKTVSKKKIIVNIDGLEWRRPKWGLIAKNALKILEWFSIRFSNADITDNIGIQRYVRRKYNSLSHMIAYGGDHNYKIEITDKNVTDYSFLRQKYDFKVARIEPENNIHVVLEAYRILSARKIVIVGNWLQSQYGIDLKLKYSRYANIHLLDPIYNLETLNVLRSNCQVYVHGHSAGGTNPSLVEAMYLGLPVLAYKVSFNEFTTEGKAIFFSSTQELVNHLRNTSLSEWQEVASNLSQLAISKYKWSIISYQYIDAFKSLDYDYVKMWDNPFAKLTREELTRNGWLHMVNRDVGGVF